MSIAIGDIVEGTITGIQPYGAFVSLSSDLKGLIHISELSYGFVKDVGQFVQVGDTVRVKVIDIDKESNQVRLSIKALQKNTARKDNRRYKVQPVPKMKLGFTTLKQKLPIWLKEKREEKKNDSV